MLRRVHGWVADGRLFEPGTKVWMCWGRFNCALSVALKRGLGHRRWLMAGAGEVRGNVGRSMGSCCRCSGTYSGVPLWYKVAGDLRRIKSLNGGRGRVACRRGWIQFGDDGVS